MTNPICGAAARRPHRRSKTCNTEMHDENPKLDFDTLEFTELPPNMPGWYCMRFRRPWQTHYEYRFVKLDFIDPITGASFLGGIELHVTEPPCYRARVSSVYSNLYVGWEWSVRLFNLED